MKEDCFVTIHREKKIYANELIIIKHEIKMK